MSIIEETNDDRLYHYTSTEALYEIIKNKELWLGNILNMNDESEQIFFIKKIENMLLENVPNEKEKIENYFKIIYSRLKVEPCYAFCLSSLRDDASLWERYADNAKGVCIVINRKKYMDIVEKAGLIFIDEVSYDSKLEEHEHYKILKKYFETGEISGGFQNINGQQDNFIACSSFYKHSSFSSEKEIRTATLLSVEYLNKECSKIEFENRGSCIKEFLKIRYDQICQKNNIEYLDLFDEIIIGPRSNQNDKMLKDFCAKKGFENIKITKSNCPLR